MIFDLLDINVWLALEVKTHALHNAAAAWFQQRGGRRCAFCRVTQMAFLRLLTNKSVMGTAVQTPANAWWTYRQMVNSSEVVFLPEQKNFEERWERFGTRGGTSGSWWTDAYLAAFAIEHGVRLVTFDQDFHRFVTDGLSLLVLDPSPHP